jgi:hypothetical protein
MASGADHPLVSPLAHVLTSFGDDIASTVEGVTAHVEFHRSRIYLVAGTLSFYVPRERERELVVVSINVKAGFAPSWEVDAIDRDSVVFAEMGPLGLEQAKMLIEEPGTAAAKVEAFLTDIRDSVEAQLSHASLE